MYMGTMSGIDHVYHMLCVGFSVIFGSGCYWPVERERELRGEGGKSLLAYVKGVDPYLIQQITDYKVAPQRGRP